MKKNIEVSQETSEIKSETLNEKAILKEQKKKRRKKRLIYVLIFAGAFIAGIISKTISPSWAKDYEVEWSDDLGILQKDLSYGEKPAEKYDLYLPKDNTKESYGLVIYLHPGGFTSGDKSGDEKMLSWLCKKGYVAAGINYTLFSEENPDANIYTQSVEIRDAVPIIVEKAKELGYNITEMAAGGGSAGHCLAMLYAYRDADTSPVPVKFVFGAVGPSSFYPEDWGCFGFNTETDEALEGAAGLFGTMAGKKITPYMFGTPEYDDAMKDVSALLNIDDDTVPSLFCYGAYDKVQSFDASKRLDAALTEHGIPHDYLIAAHSGHGLQNDSAVMHEYSKKLGEYLDKYLPVK